MQAAQQLCKKVCVTVFSPLRTGFDYDWPSELGEPVVGVRVVVPFGHSQRLGIVTSIEGAESCKVELKTVLDRLDIEPLFCSAYTKWIRRAAAYNLCSEGEMYELATAWANHDKQRQFKLQNREALQHADADLSLAFPTKRVTSISTIMKYCHKGFVQWRVLQACQQELISEVVAEKDSVKTDACHHLTLRASQQRVVDSVLSNQDIFYPSLMFGRTGSGKTEVYLQAAEALAKKGKQTLILVPEIGLTPMWVKRLSSRFEHVEIWHSGLSPREKVRVRHNLLETQVLLGTRSALFLPLDNLGLIVIDEEHDSSFKQQDGVMYSARDMAMLLAQELNIPIILGSATPSLESWRHVQDGNMQCFRLTERVHQHASVQPEMVDMRGSNDALSPTLIKRLKETLQQGKQSMLYLNRRGYAPALQCTACGDVPTCHACSLRLTLHRKQGVLRCHTCDYMKRVEQVCKSCGEKAYLPLGAGTERLEDDLLAAIPELKLARFDRDVVRSKKDLEATLSAFEAGEIDCLVGTQMLVKGHHFPNVTLVGVVNADLGMNLPDFRASERWWQQMTQVFGRTGRGEQIGRVVVQTWSPDAPWFGRLDESKAEEVLNDELDIRKITAFPPYARWVRVVFSAVQHEKAILAAKRFADVLKSWDAVKVSGPMPCAMERIAGRFRFEVIVRDESRKLLPWKLQPLLEQMRVPFGVRRKVDVDPQDLM